MRVADGSLLRNKKAGPFGTAALRPRGPLRRQGRARRRLHVRRHQRRCCRSRRCRQLARAPRRGRVRAAAARRIDEHCAGTHAGDDGPVLRRLREVGVTGLAVGAFGEASDDAHKLLGLVATTGAAERWRDAMAPSPLGYRSVLVAQLRRVWGAASSPVRTRD